MTMSVSIAGRERNTCVRLSDEMVWFSPSAQSRRTNSIVVEVSRETGPREIVPVPNICGTAVVGRHNDITKVSSCNPCR